MMMAGAARLIDVHNFQTAAISPVQKNAKFGISSCALAWQTKPFSWSRASMGSVEMGVQRCGTPNEAVISRRDR